MAKDGRTGGGYAPWGALDAEFSAAADEAERRAALFASATEEERADWRAIESEIAETMRG